MVFIITDEFKSSLELPTCFVETKSSDRQKLLPESDQNTHKLFGQFYIFKI